MRFIYRTLALFFGRKAWEWYQNRKARSSGSGDRQDPQTRR
jgi:hypothetical protein